eukprot:scaffold692120_cov51-Attheya_sp.AAC.1
MAFNIRRPLGTTAAECRGRLDTSARNLEISVIGGVSVSVIQDVESKVKEVGAGGRLSFDGESRCVRPGGRGRLSLAEAVRAHGLNQHGKHGKRGTVTEIVASEAQ